MKMKMNKNNIEFFCTLKTVGNTFQPKTKQNSNTKTMRYQLPQHFV
jgi:hypothetical protein